MNEDIAIAKDPSRVAGGKARAASMTPEERTAQARHAAEVRWTNPRTKPLVVPPRDDGIRQQHGVGAMNNGTVRAWESEQFITVRVYGDGGGTERQLTPESARYFADQLYALARRIDRRQGK